MLIPNMSPPYASSNFNEIAPGHPVAPVAVKTTYQNPFQETTQGQTNFFNFLKPDF